MSKVWARMLIAGTVKPLTSPRARAMYSSWMLADRAPSSWLASQTIHWAAATAASSFENAAVHARSRMPSPRSRASSATVSRSPSMRAMPSSRPRRSETELATCGMRRLLGCGDAAMVAATAEPVPRPRRERTPSVPLRDLDQVAARVVEDGRRHRAHLEGFLGERDAHRPEPVELRPDVFDGERRERDAVVDEGLLERLRGRVTIGLEEQLRSVGLVPRRDRQPLGVAERDLRLLLEAENTGIEVESLVLVIDEDARQVDPHVIPFPSWAATDRRSVRAAH